MNALTFLRLFAKPITALLFCIAMYGAFKYHNHLQQTIGKLEITLNLKDQQLVKQDQDIANIKTQIYQQSQAIAELQMVQDSLQSLSELRKMTLKEIFTNDQDAKNWAKQPVPDAVRSMFNNTQTTTKGTEDLSSTNTMSKTNSQYKYQ